MMDSIHVRFWIFAILACTAAMLPFMPESYLITSDTRIFGAPVLWIVGFCGASYFNRRIGMRQWWLWLAAPLAFRYVAELIVMLILAAIMRDKL
jgi:hypothetical protein